MTSRDRHFIAIFENGVFRPLEPVDCPEHEKVDVIWRRGRVAEDDLVDPDCERYCRKVGHKAKPIEEVRQSLAKIPGSLSDFVRMERDAD
jgi:predicted DNA-binding antitoxin AbrB/MazE fold protein